MLFENNAEMSMRSFETKIGCLEPGAAADIVISDYNPLTPMTSDNCDGHILFGMSGRSIITTIINGVVKMKDRELVGIDSERIMAKCTEQSAAMWKRINSR